MEATKYFIERKDTGEWYYQKFGFVEGNNTAHPGEMSCEIGWTIDPLQAESFDLAEYAQDFANHEWGLKDFDYHITEHLFIVNRVGKVEVMGR